VKKGVSPKRNQSNNWQGIQLLIPGGGKVCAGKKGGGPIREKKFNGRGKGGRALSQTGGGGGTGYKYIKWGNVIVTEERQTFFEATKREGESHQQQTRGDRNSLY